MLQRQKFAITAVVIGAVVLSAFVAYFIPISKKVTVQPATLEEQEKYDALDVAQRFITTSSTFAFDGDINSL